MKKLVFNHFYRLKHDLKRTYILGGVNCVDSKVRVTELCSQKIHPYFAMLFSLFSIPIEYSKAVDEVSYCFDIDKYKAEQLIKLFYHNDEFTLKYCDVLNGFPKNIIIDHDEATSLRERIYSPESFNYKELDFDSFRPFTSPITVVVMITNNCLTDCLYCYADKVTKLVTLPIDKLISIIRDADRNNISSIIITGGEFFVYKDWEKALEELINYQYRPNLISTKVPITEDIIRRFKKYSIPIQISLDSINSDVLQRMLKVNEHYLYKIKNTIQLLEKYDIPFQIATVLTNYNESIEDLESLYGFLSKFKNMRRWEIRVVFKSLYSKSNFSLIKPSKTALREIANWVDMKIHSSSMNILWSPEKENNYYTSEFGSESFKGNRCSANMSNMVILPDGKVTICEQLYWKERFIVGDIYKQSISEIWASDKARNILSCSKEDFNYDSPCKSCKIFEECMSFSNRCIADIIKAYGDDKYDYPDPRCVKAPRFI